MSPLAPPTGRVPKSSPVQAVGIVEVISAKAGLN